MDLITRILREENQQFFDHHHHTIIYAYICNIFVCSTYVNISISCVYLFGKHIASVRFYIYHIFNYIYIYIYLYNKYLYKCMWIEKDLKCFNHIHLYFWRSFSPKLTTFGSRTQNSADLGPQMQSIHILMILQTMFFHFQTSNQIQKHTNMV